MVIFAKIVHVAKQETTHTLFVLSTENYVISCQKKLQKREICEKRSLYRTSIYSTVSNFKKVKKYAKHL